MGLDVAMLGRSASEAVVMPAGGEPLIGIELSAEASAKPDAVTEPFAGMASRDISPALATTMAAATANEMS